MRKRGAGIAALSQRQDGDWVAQSSEGEGETEVGTPDARDDVVWAAPTAGKS